VPFIAGRAGRKRGIQAPPGLTTAYDNVIDADGPWSHWKLGESAGTTAADRKTLRDGTYVGAPTIGSNVLVSGNSGDNAVNLNGTSHRITTARDPGLDFTGTAPFSLEVWAKITRWDSNVRRILSHEDATNGYNISVINAATHPYAIRFERTVSGVTRIAEATGLQLHAVYHIVGVYTGTELRIYVDGEETIGEADARSMPTHTGAFYIGDRSA
jgi:hypothetical protein